ncbi:sulfurtransferase-like selenium metabolism protein YedF [Shewanella submarina]|uniref:Sulfurtransferase-like selenium metabolism protein YedF n=1 Tax=Shewanella submarina TaxID=2016376 RepID=A0ABV7GIL0_9GAMM|nr:sulfurtransferase-like selenium metabolism protein YedF [Shewanella submarina]MCL1035777.1 sulfurtransferase-like selenium metabolism protein YedF [Shewanella submarina]
MVQSASDVVAEVDFQLEVWGEPCPYPVVATLDALKQMQSGETLEVVTDCLQSINNIPTDAKRHGHEVLEVEQQGPQVRVVIRKA